jgi:hypothetical protein
MDALDAAGKLVSLDSLTPPEVTNHKKWIYRRIYQAQRSGLMHAKRGQNYLLPHDATNRAELIASLARLWDYIKYLIQRHLGVTHLSSSLSLYAVKAGAEAVLLGHTMVLSDGNSAQVGPDGAIPIPEGAAVVELSPATPAADPDDPELWTLLTHRDAGDIAELTAIRCFGIMSLDDGSTHVLSELVGPLIVGSAVARLEMAWGVRHVNPSGAPRTFSS